MLGRTSRLAVIAAAAVGWLWTSPTFAGTTDQDVRLGDKVTGAILVAQGDSVGIRFYAVKDAKVTVSVGAVKGTTLVPALRLVGPSGPIDIATLVKTKGQKATLSKFPVTESGTYTLEVSGASGTGAFVAATKGAFPKRVVVTGNGPGTVGVAVQPGTTVKGTIVADKGTTLEPTITSFVDSDGDVHVLTDVTAKGAKAKFTTIATAGGACQLVVGGTGAGTLRATFSLKVPKSKETIDATDAIGASVVAAVVVAGEPAAADWDGFPALSATVSSATAKGSTGHVYAGEFNMTGSKAGLADQVVDVRAAHDATYLYMRFRWRDATTTNDLNRRRWYFNGGAAAVTPDWSTQFGAAITTHPLATSEAVPTGWSPNLNDDKLGVAWAIGDPDSVSTDGAGNEAGLAPGTTFRQAGCAVACHNSLGMGPPTGLMDIWHWKTSRSNPVGYVNDQWAGNGAARATDTGQGIEGRNRNVNNAGGPTRVLNPVAPGVTVDKLAGTATIAFNSVLNGLIDLDARVMLSFDASMPIESTDAVGGNAVFAANCQACHGADGKGVATAPFHRVGLTWTRAEMVAKANSAAHGGGNRGLDDTVGDLGQTVTAADTDRLVARIRGFAGAPGYWLREGDGVTFNVDDIAQVRNFATVYDAATGNFTVIVRRKLVTADATQDVQFNDLAQTYLFGLAIMEFDGKNHAGAPLLKMVFGR